MVTETSSMGDYAHRAAWMEETLQGVRRLRQSGVPVIGYTWFPLFSMIEWNYREGDRPLDQYTLNLGLVDCHYDQNRVFQRCKTPLFERYQRHISGQTEKVKPAFTTQFIVETT